MGKICNTTTDLEDIEIQLDINLKQLLNEKHITTIIPYKNNKHIRKLYTLEMIDDINSKYYKMYKFSLYINSGARLMAEDISKNNPCFYCYIEQRILILY